MFPCYSFSYPSGPPTPSITPKSASFGKDPFGTPRQESNFYDPSFSPADAFAASPEFLRTPKFQSFTTPTKSPTLSRGTKRPFSGHDVENEIATHVHHLSPNPNLPLPPVEPSRQLSSSPNPSASEKHTNSTQNSIITQEIDLDKDIGASMRSASSMQTPPPTSTSASKRKAQQAQVAKLVKESAANGGRKLNPLFPSVSNAAVLTSPVEHSPQNFSAVQFSPEVLGSFSMAGPATAPVYPQQKLFWDPAQDSNAMNIDFGATDTFADSFGLETSKQVMESFASNNEAMIMSHTATSSFGIDDIMGSTMPATASAAQHTNYLSSAGLITNGTGSRMSNTAVDPSLLFSSPSAAPEQTTVNVPNQVMHDDNLQPYAHQIREAQRERESSETRKPKRRRGPPAESPAVKAALETLRGEEEDRSRGSLNAERSIKPSGSGFQSKSAASGKPGRASVVPRRSSNTKQGYGLGIHAPLQRQPKQTVTLSIGPDGRAKTQRQLVAERKSPSAMEVDSDSGDTESLSSADGYMAISQPSSFVYPIKKPTISRRGKLNRGAVHSQKSSYSSAQNYAVDPALTSTFVSGPLGDSKEVESEAETVFDSENERGDAQSELKKIVKKRVQRRRSGNLNNSGSGREILDRRNVFTGNTFLPPQALTPTHDMFNNISPTTITDPDLATPSSARDSTVSGSSTRCVCHNPDSDGEFMILW